MFATASSALRRCFDRCPFRSRIDGGEKFPDLALADHF
jgi:hypothetical protein